jgi:hypothetical protein
MNSVPPKINAPVAGWRLPAAILAITFLALGGILYFFNPSTHHFYPECQFHRLTGLNCPGCGMTRAAYALLHGEWAAAVRDNALLTGTLAWLLVRGAWFGLNRRRGRRNGEFFPAKHLWLLLALALVFTVLRNLPALAFLSP